MEYLIRRHEKGGPLAQWCANEKTALEAALGMSFAGRRSIVTMKHVGLNVAADPFMNAALLGITGGLAVASADDPGMHSSQNEQDSRFYAAFAMVPCLEPRNQQEAYDMTREAFAISEQLQVPTLIRLVTRLSHARAAVNLREDRAQNPCAKTSDFTRWSLLPMYARRNYADVIKNQQEIQRWSETHPANALELDGRDRKFAVITAGLGGNYYEENLADFERARGGTLPARLHIGAYPIPEESLRRLCGPAETALVIEEGQPFIEERLRGILPQTIRVSGKLDGTLNRTGELDPDTVRKALGLPPRETMLERVSVPQLPGRPPQLCQGCPHSDSYETLKRALAGLERFSVTADIGCYSLGALPPYQAIESIVCMGASVGMAKGASDAGIEYAVAVIGDSTFLHSGIPGLIDAVASDARMTLIILDNSTVAMTGCQTPIMPSANLRNLILGLGVSADHFAELPATKQMMEANVARLRAEIMHPGLSVAVFRRECLEAARKRRS
jgi:indolepyruvate ferredoxin oxidoreductase alpha subunit